MLAALCSLSRSEPIGSSVTVARGGGGVAADPADPVMRSVLGVDGADPATRELNCTPIGDNATGPAVSIGARPDCVRAGDSTA